MTEVKQAKKIKKLIIIGLCIIFPYTAVNTSNSYAAATPTYNDHVYQRGVGNVAVWLDYSSGIGYWETYIQNARTNWMYTGYGGNPIYMNFVNSSYGSNMDIYRKDNQFFYYINPSFTYFAGTSHFLNSINIDPSTANWSYAEIYINHDEFIKPSFSNDQALGTTIHEMGHAFGLNENNGNIYSIMCQTGSGRAVQRVQAIDNQSINDLY